MNKEKATGYSRLIVTFLVAVILVFTFGLVADGWQQANGETPDAEGDDPTVDVPDNNTDNGDDTEVGAVPEPPKFYNRLSGLECSEDASKKSHLAYTVHSNLPFYAISSCDMLVEFPVEDGQTRLLVFTSDFSKFGKIGTLAKTRSYITNIANNFGAILLSMGDDTKIVSAGSSSIREINLEQSDGYHYTEYTHYAYTNSTLVNSALQNLGINMYNTSQVTLPYAFSNADKEATLGDIKAERVYIPYSISQDTSFSYSSVTKKYTYEKSGVPKKDNLTNEFITFDNIFILFADSVTYEDKNGTTMNVETEKGGEGYFVSCGAARKIHWTSTEDGLKFTDAYGGELVVNPGINYIGYAKSSKTNEVTFS